jgi:hypothetical protein
MFSVATLCCQREGEKSVNVAKRIARNISVGGGARIFGFSRLRVKYYGVVLAALLIIPETINETVGHRNQNAIFLLMKYSSL